MSHDPDDPHFEFAFAGLPCFVFAASPSHRGRRSRNLCPGQVPLFQPRSLFSGIEGGTKTRDAVRRTIRERLVRWEGVAPHLDLGDYDLPTKRHRSTAGPDGATYAILLT